jgi:hypothetical protein
MLTNRKDLAYATDAMIPGVYLWLGGVCLMLGGCKSDDRYPFQMVSQFGGAIVLPSFKSFEFNVKYSG